ncbi:hypothetical protein [Mesorhizobium sp.]|nr:hypothetical protein [Mesorhizobium sp.]
MDRQTFSPIIPSLAPEMSDLSLDRLDAVAPLPGGPCNDDHRQLVERLSA